MPKQKPEAFGVTLLRCPDGSFAVVAGPIDLTRAEALSPKWHRDVLKSVEREQRVEPNGMNGWKGAKVKVPVLIKDRTEPVYGESMKRALRRVNIELGKLANAALIGEPTAGAVLAGMQRATKPTRKPVELSEYDAMLVSERSAGFLGRPRMYVERELRRMGRTEADIAKYLEKRERVLAPEVAA